MCRIYAIGTIIDKSMTADGVVVYRNVQMVSMSLAFDDNHDNDNNDDNNNEYAAYIKFVFHIFICIVCVVVDLNNSNRWISYTLSVQFNTHMPLHVNFTTQPYNNCTHGFKYELPTIIH
jgi:hypothetical protein